MTAGEHSRSGSASAAARFNHNLWKRYRLTCAEFEAMLRRQDGRCAACGYNGKLVVDHDHATGDVRGLLCLRCNLVMGAMRENVVHLAGLIAYLDRPAVHTGEELQDRPRRLGQHLLARVSALEAELEDLRTTTALALPKDP